MPPRLVVASTSALVPLVPHSDQVVLYGPKALQRVRPRVLPPFISELGQSSDEELEVIGDAERDERCPLCRQLLPSNGLPAHDTPPLHPGRRRIPLGSAVKESSYFIMLSRASTPQPTRSTTPVENCSTPLDRSSLNTGYFATYFKVLEKLGQGGNGAVHLVRHTLNGEALGLYAVKRIAVGDSKKHLLKILREVHLLESLSHRNVITYQHAWMEEESSQHNAFAPPVPTLFVLMQYANGGNLQSFINERGPLRTDQEAGLSRAERVRLFRHRRELSAVHLLRLDEILDLFEDVCSGLAFLHARGILHLDLKSENVLLNWEEEGDLLPCAKLSDFGSADFSSESWHRERTGASGTVEWMPPESWDLDSKTGRLHVPDRSTDLWALGLILHLLSFFVLPYHKSRDDDLEQEIRSYPGFFIVDAHSLDHGTRHDLPQEVLRLMSRLVHRLPASRPSCVEVLAIVRQLRKEMDKPPTTPDASALVKVATPPFRFAPVRQKIKEEIVVWRTAPSKSLLLWRRLDEKHLHRLLVAVLALGKAISIQRFCGSGGLTGLAVYAVLLPTLTDTAFGSWWATLSLGSLHLFLLLFQGGRLCVV